MAEDKIDVRVNGYRDGVVVRMPSGYGFQMTPKEALDLIYDILLVLRDSGLLEQRRAEIRGE